MTCSLNTRLTRARELARGAGEIQRKHYGCKINIETKSTDIDLVTEVDRACETLIVEGISTSFPQDSVLAEEGGGYDRSGADWCWLIDPLDGTTNFVHSYPRFCVSIAVEYQGERAIAVVYDPLLDELFSATRDGGAFVNGKPIHVSDEKILRHSLLATGFTYDHRKNYHANIDHFAGFLKSARALRRDGSAALDLCYVSSGRLDGFWELKLAPWDIAAGILLVEEAGGTCSNLAGNAPPRSGEEIVASNGHIHKDMIEVLDRYK